MWSPGENTANEQQGSEFKSSAGLATQRLPPLPPGMVQPEAAEPGTWRVAFKMFKSNMKSWDEMFREAAEYASRLGSERLINISHSADSGTGVVTVWFWADWNDDPR